MWGTDIIMSLTWSLSLDIIRSFLNPTSAILMTLSHVTFPITLPKTWLVYNHNNLHTAVSTMSSSCMFCIICAVCLIHVCVKKVKIEFCFCFFFCQMFVHSACFRPVGKNLSQIRNQTGGPNRRKPFLVSFKFNPCLTNDIISDDDDDRVSGWN